MEKNVDEILRVADELPEYRFVIVGEGPFRDRLNEDAPDNVTLRDFLPREELPVFYSSIDAFLTASIADTLGLSTLEANACGTPVIAADVPPFNETIGPDNGLRFEYGDLETTVETVQRCLEANWKTRAAVERYSVDQTLIHLEQLYEHVSPSRSVPSTSDGVQWQGHMSDDEQY